MGKLRMVILMVASTALLIFVSYIPAGEAGSVIALGVAAVIYFTAYGNADKIILRT